MSTVEEKIAWYEAKIAEIESGGGIYADATTKEKLAAIHDCHNAIHDLRAQQGMFLMIIIFCFLAAILTCLCVLIAFY